MKIQERKQILKSCENFITGIAVNDNMEKSIIVSGASGQIIFIEVEPFKILKTVKVFDEFATCILPFQDGILVGSKNGSLAYLDSQDKIAYQQKIHEDVISSIISIDNYLVTTGHDGHIFFLNQSTFEIEQRVNVETPILRATKHQKSIYTAGNPSFCINSSTFEIKLMKRFDFFANFNRKLYGCSDERGLSCISTGSNSYIPCNFIIPMEGRMLIFSDQCIGELFHRDHMEWKCHKTRQIDIGATIIGGCSIAEQIILVDDQGMIYRIAYQYSSSEP